jgi:hypothetical protein
MNRFLYRRPIYLSKLEKVGQLVYSHRKLY